VAASQAEDGLDPSESVVTADQLQFELVTEPPVAALSRHLDPGAQRLLAALVRQGGNAEGLAEWALAMEEGAFPSSALRPRSCRCHPHTLPVPDGLDVRCLLCGRAERGVS
jgi:hypothetical protein